MIVFIFVSLAYIAGMACTVLFEIHKALPFFLSSLFFVLGAFFVFFRKHGSLIQEGNYSEIFKDENPLPIFAIILFAIGVFLFGIFRYSHELYSISPKHISKIMVSEETNTRWRLVGKVVEEPNLKNEYLEVLIEPEIVQQMVRKPKFVKSSFEKKGGKGSKKRGKKGKNSTPIGKIEGIVPEFGKVASYPLTPALPPPEEQKVEGGLIIAQVF
ncbi:hypothetical protein HYY75_10005, partial [bacterium]|nr:hypothetical protein [bacterium]